MKQSEVVAAQEGEPLADAVAPGAARRQRGNVDVLDGGERLQIVDTLIAVLDGTYCHLPQKRAAYALDPVQALHLLRRRCAELTDSQFHLALTTLVTELRDAHTRYVGPTGMHDQVAVLPFLVEQYGPYDDPTFVVSKTAPSSGVDDPGFVAGVTLEWWNGMPMTRAVEIYSEHETGGRPDARRARALESLTFRSLAYGPPPDEHWVDIGYRNARGTARSTRVPWRVVGPGRARSSSNSGSRAALKIAVNLAAEQVRRAKQLLFAPQAWNPKRPASDPVPNRGSRADTPLPSRLPDVLAAREVKTTVGRFGLLRIWSFDVSDDDAFIEEVSRLVGLLPQNGLIIDLRANPGGLIWAAERLLQLFTPNRIEPTRFSLLASPLTRAMAASPFNRLELEAWQPSLEDAISTGEQYSRPLPLTDPEWCNDIGQRYTGPVVAVVDPNTYSSGDLFAAGFVDNGLGPLVTVGAATGGGGANVWTYADVRDALTDTEHPVQALPNGVNFSVAIRRAIRSGPADGIPIEDLGIAGIPYTMTKNDLLRNNRDLINYCAQQLVA